MRTRLLPWTFAVAALAVPACTSKEPSSAQSAPAPTTTPSSPPGSPPTTARSGPKLDDAQIAAIVVAANQVDIDAGKLALEKSKNAEVKKLAERMVTDHSAVNQAAVELVTRLKVTPAESDASRSLSSGGADTRARLTQLDGAAFDRAYVDNEVAYHEAVIGVLESQLIPSATNQELKDALVGAKPAFDAHLQHARQIQSALAGGAPVAHDHGHP